MKITDTMQTFISGESDRLKEDCARKLNEQWASFPPGALASTFALVWSAHHDWVGTVDELITRLIGGYGTFDHCRMERWKVCVGSGGKVARSFKNSILIECDFTGLDLRGARFDNAWLESVNFAGADLREVDFSGASLLDVDITDANLKRANMVSVEPGLYVKSGNTEYADKRALGVIARRGATVGELDNLYIAMAHPRYEIARKIARKLIEGGSSQLLGLTQRGASQKDPAAAQRFVDLLVTIGYAAYDRSGSARTVDTTVNGRIPLRQLAEETKLDEAFAKYFDLHNRK